MAIVSPSILSADFGKLGADCRMVLDAGAQMLHYDVMDGHFVPNISFGVPVLKSLHKNLPDAFYDVHLMISHPLQYAEAFIKACATLYNFHLECEDDIQATKTSLRAQKRTLFSLRSIWHLFFSGMAARKHRDKKRPYRY